MTLTSTTLRPSALRPVHPLPVIDEDQLLRLQDRWVALTDLQVPVVEHLLDHLGAMVPIDDLRSAYGGAGGSTDDEAMRSLLHRIGRRLTAVGAIVTFAPNRRGIMVTVADGDRPAAAS